jgi:hypothetical protein
LRDRWKLRIAVSTNAEHGGRTIAAANPHFPATRKGDRGAGSVSRT